MNTNTHMEDKKYCSKCKSPKSKCSCDCDDKDEVEEGLISKFVDKVKGREQIGTTGSGGKIYRSTRSKPSKVKYGSASSTKKPTPKKSSSTDHDDLNKFFEQFISESAAWTNNEGKNKNGGLNEKGRKSYEDENPGSDLKAPSKEVGNPRRKSFCSRMKGMKKKLTSAKTAKDPDSRINKSLRAWNC